MTQFREITAGGESHNIVPDPRDPQVVYGGTVEKLDLRTMQTQSVDPTLAEPGEYRSAWTLPLAFSRRDPRVLYFANQKLFRTEDGGRHWAAISPDLTRDDFRPYVYRTRDGGRTWTLAVDGIPSNEAVNVVRADPGRRGLLYVGTERGVT